MKLVRFVLLLFRQGSWRVNRVDFDDERNKVLDPSLLPGPAPKKRKERAWKAYQMRTPAGYSLISNLAYLKNSGRMNKMYFVSHIHRAVYIQVDKDAEALNNFLQQFGVHLPHLNKRPRDYNYSSYYDSETLTITGRLYAGDVRRFGYEEDLRLLQQLVNAHE